MGNLGLVGIIHLALVIFAALKIFGSSADIIKKLIWLLVVAMFPLIGLIIWYLMGPGSPNK